MKFVTKSGSTYTTSNENGKLFLSRESDHEVLFVLPDHPTDKWELDAPSDIKIGERATFRLTDKVLGSLTTSEVVEIVSF